MTETCAGEEKEHRGERDGGKQAEETDKSQLARLDQTLGEWQVLEINGEEVQRVKYGMGAGAGFVLGETRLKDSL